MSAPDKPKMGTYKYGLKIRVSKILFKIGVLSAFLKFILLDFSGVFQAFHDFLKIETTEENGLNLGFPLLKV